MQIKLSHRYEHELTKNNVIETLLHNIASPTILDLGAHHGQDTRDFLAVLDSNFKQGRIICVEAHPQSVQKIRQIDDKRVTVIHAAVTNKLGSGPFNLCTSVCPDMPQAGPWDAASSLKLPTNPGWLRYDEVTEVPYLTLNKLYSDFVSPAKIDFIWCDVEGEVGEVIYGGVVALENTRYFYTEINDVETYKGQMIYWELYEEMKSQGFELVFKFKHDALFRNVSLTESIEVI